MKNDNLTLPRFLGPKCRPAKRLGQQTFAELKIKSKQLAVINSQKYFLHHI